ncbi:MAG: hypothetical protein EOP59_05495 [Sphingomonadales bacterium]|nr:MAG: hypothetical protein EOP59_05495 [Sphingomonadales bacterium]
MQAPEQQIHIDRANKLVDVRISGFVTAEDASWLGEDVRAAIRTFGGDVGKHVTLYDMAHLEIAPGETVEIVKAMFVNPHVRPLWARKVAIVTGSALGRLQLQRLRDARSDIALFDDRETARDWLLAP